MLPMRNQDKNCGTCYAKESITFIERLIKISTGSWARLSPEEIVDCDDQNSGCVGVMTLH